VGDQEVRVVRVGIVVALFATVAAVWPHQEVRTIVIDIEHSAFHPEKLQVDAGEKVRFVIVNKDPIDHEFILGDQVLQFIHEKGTESHHGTRPGEVSIAALDTATTTYEFTTAGTLIYGCHIPSHYDYGMRGEVEVR
jgi:uncharacterized cupredoxin-like copper-binding protein